MNNFIIYSQDNDFGYDKKEDDGDVKKVENQHFDEAYDLSDENDESGILIYS